MPYIYIIHCRASINNNECVFKIGKTQDFVKRFTGYDKGSIPVFVIYVKECNNLELSLIQKFDMRFSRRRDYGNEYFEGDINEMINIIVNEYNNDNTLQYNCNNDQPLKETNLFKNSDWIIKNKNQLLKMLNKINQTNVQRFRNDISLYSNDYQNNQYYCMLYNYSTNYTNPNCILSTPKIKLGDYLENNYGFVNNFVSSWYNSQNDNTYEKLYERIKLCL